MEEKIKNIFSRQYKRLETNLKEVKCPQLFLDAISKYFKFCEEDIIKGIKEQGNDNQITK